MKCFTAVGVTAPNGSDHTTVFIKGSHFFHGTTSFSRAQEFAQSRQMASNELLLQMTSWVLGTTHDSNLTAGGARKKDESRQCCSLLPSFIPQIRLFLLRADSGVQR